MTLKEMKEQARKAFEAKNGPSTEYIETVGNKGVEHERPTGPAPKPTRGRRGGEDDEG